MDMLYVKFVHQFLRPRTISERAAVGISHHVPQFMEHDLTGIRVVIKPHPGRLLGTEN